MKKTTLSGHEKKAGITEGDLIEAFEHVVREDHANPTRVDCLSKKELKQAASSPSHISQSILDHIAVCASCLTEYDRLRRGRQVGY